MIDFKETPLQATTENVLTVSRSDVFLQVVAKDNTSEPVRRGKPGTAATVLNSCPDSCSVVQTAPPDERYVFCAML